jgi:uncharacterized protein
MNRYFCTICFLLFLGCCCCQAQEISTRVRFLSCRFLPGQDLKKEIMNLAIDQKINAAIIISCTGNLKKTTILYPARDKAKTANRNYDVVNLQGTFSRFGGNFKITIADKNGKTRSGTLLEGTEIKTTVEIVFAIFDDVSYLRTYDPATGYPELDIKKQQN